MSSEAKLHPKIVAWQIAKWIPATVLASAALLKILATPQLLESNGILSNAALLYPVIFAEIVCAILIVSLQAGASWTLTLAVFSTLLVIAIAAQVLGLNCNCLGSNLPSWTSIVLDVAMMALCAMLRPRANGTGFNAPVLFAFLWASASALLGTGAAYYLDANAERNNPLSFLLADELIGKPWPIESSLRQELSLLENGRWVVVVIRRDCEHCRELLETHFRDPARKRQGERTALFVAGSAQWPFTFDFVSLDATPSGSVAWPDIEPFVASPAVFLVVDGIVTEAADGVESAEFVAEIFADVESRETGEH